MAERNIVNNRLVNQRIAQSRTGRTAALEARHFTKVYSAKNMIFKPTMVLDGRVAGTWQRTIKKKSVEITTAPFVKMKKPETSALGPIGALRAISRVARIVEVRTIYLPARRSLRN